MFYSRPKQPCSCVGQLGVRNHIMHTRPIVSFFIAATVLAFLTGCQRSDLNLGAPAHSGSSVQITSISPDIGQTLYVGDKVKLKVDVNYALTEDSGTLTLVVQSADNTFISQNLEVVSKGTGKVALEAEFTVPSTKAIQVFTPISGQGQNATSTVDSRAFKVAVK